MPLRTPHETTAPGDRRLHLPPLETRLFVRALPWRLRESLLHLLRCAACRDALRAELKAPDPTPEALPDARYDEAFQRAEERGRALEEERRRAAGVLDEMFQQPPDSWPAFLAERADAAQPAFILLLLEHASRAAGTDPATGEKLAHLARLRTEKLEVAAFPGRLRHELLARAWITLGHTRALLHEWPGADQAFARASHLLSEMPSPLAEAELCRYLAASFLSRDRQPEALALLARAALLADETATVETEIGDLGELARAHLERGDHACAVGLLAGALVLASSAGLTLTKAQLRLQLAWTLHALGRHREALELAELYEGTKAATGTLEGMLGAALVHACRGEVRYAEAVFGVALSRALGEGEDFLAALAALNLIGIYDHESRADALQVFAPTVGALAEAPALSGATRAALAALHAALRDQTGSLGILLLGAVAALDHQANTPMEQPQSGGGTAPP